MSFPLLFTLSSLYLLLALSFYLSHVVCSTTHPDFLPLLSFKASSDPLNTSPLLSQWNSTSSNPCTWRGVSCNLRNSNRVSRLVLENLNLSGAGAASILPLTSLSQLRILSLKSNRFEGPIPTHLANLTALKLLFLSYNHFHGEIPVSFAASLPHLYRLDLSHNRLSGEIPAAVNRLTHLLTLRLDNNNLRGRIPNLNSLSQLQDFDVSNNHLSGQIPDSLSPFPGSAFSNNLFLCGAPLRKCEDKTKAIPAVASPLRPRNDTVSRKSKTHAAPRMGVLVLITIVLGDVLVLAIVSLLLYCYFWRNYSSAAALKESKEESSHSKAAVYGGGGMVFMEGVRRFELEELLRASAEMLGKGVFGTAYKAVLDDGSVVAVKRLKEVSVFGGKREFFQQRMEVLGRLRHCNVVPLRAYYFAKDEKLLVSDYMPNGSLSWLLHGNRGPGRTPLDWTTRLKIAVGAARGLAFIHNHNSDNNNNKLTHGNIKSTNILIDVARNTRVSDFGLSSIFAAASRSNNNGYRAPEASSDVRKQTQPSDVYSFGVLLMEILTGKCPSAAADGGGCAAAVELPRWLRSVVREEWTAEVFDLELMRYKDIEEEMVALLQIAMACTETAPDRRPTMCHVAKMIEELSGAQVSPCHDALDSVSVSHSVTEDACTAGDGATASQ